MTDWAMSAAAMTDALRTGEAITRDDLVPIDHAQRVRRVHHLMQPGQATLYLDLVDVRWLTGFTGSNGWLVVTSDEVVLGTDGRYGERAAAETALAGVTVIVESQPGRLHTRLVETLRASSVVGLDASTVTQARWSQLVADASIEPTQSVIKGLREVKDDAEMTRMAFAARAADAALAEVEPLLFGTIDAPVTEADIRNELEYRMRRHGADDRSYDTIVASGPDHAARPHHEPTRRTIVAGDTVIIDVGALVDGYHSDMTRSYVIGAPTELQRDLYELVSRSQRAGIAAVRPGVSARNVDEASRAVFVEAGYGDWYLHGTGHGVGLQIHECPFHSATSPDTIAAGNVVTVEPGLYRVGFGGFRIEDLLVVTELGSHPLTHAPERPFTP